LVQLEFLHRRRHRGILVTESEAQSKIARYLPIVIGVEEQLVTIPVVIAADRTHDVSLSHNIGCEIAQKPIQVRVVVVATDTLNKWRTRARDQVMSIKTELHIVFRLEPAQILRKLIRVLSSLLRRKRIGTNLQIQVVANLQIRKPVESRELEVAGR